jgi:hypothetical protein
MQTMVNTTIKAAPMTWQDASNGVKLTSPGLSVAGYTMVFAYIPAGKTMRVVGNTRVIINCLEGSLTRPALKQRDSITIKQNRFIQAETDSLVYICVDETEAAMQGDEMKGPIDGLPLKWVEPAPGCNRTDPKLEVGNHRVNLWYLIPNKNGGIHNHAEVTDHNPAEQFIEFHTQLRGSGHMVKYKEKKEETEYERLELNPGDTHPLFSTIEEGIVKYPWHAYVASQTGALFLAFEEINLDLKEE